MLIRPTYVDFITKTSSIFPILFSAHELSCRHFPDSRRSTTKEIPGNGRVFINSLLLTTHQTLSLEKKPFRKDSERIFFVFVGILLSLAFDVDMFADTFRCVFDV